MNRKSATMAVEEAAELLGISRSAAYRAIQRGDIPIIRLGRKIRIPIPAFERLLSEGNTRPAAAAGAR